MEERGAVLCLVARRAAVWSQTPTHAHRRAYISSGVIVTEVSGAHTSQQRLHHLGGVTRPGGNHPVQSWGHALG